MSEHNFLCRVLRIQKHKCSNFIYVSGFELARQLLIDDLLMSQYDIGIMSIIKGKCIETKNNVGKTIYQVCLIESHVKAAACLTYQENYTNKALLYKKCRNEILFQVENFLGRNNFQSVNSPFTIPFRGTSTASPLKISGKYVNRYCKITHELGIKKMMSELLCPVYEIGYVARDIYSTMTTWFEYNILEFVSPIHDLTFIENFIKEFIQIATSVADEWGIKHRDFSSFKVLRLEDDNTYEGRHFEDLRHSEENVIFLNAPVESPLVKCIDGRRSETIWYLYGDSMAHGYCDENDWSILRDLSLKQQAELKRKGIDAELSLDFLELLELGMPNSVSLGIGIDKFFQQFFMFTNLKEYHKYMD